MRIPIKISEGKELFIKCNVFDEGNDIDVDKILKIDFFNLISEIVTFPSILNKLGILLGQVENSLREAEIDYKIWKAKEQERIRNRWDNDVNKKVVRGYKYTKDEVYDNLCTSPVYKAKKNRLSRLQKEKDYVSSIYWSAKAKSDQLSKLSLTLGEIDSSDLPKEFNGVRIKVDRPLIGK